MRALRHLWDGWKRFGKKAGEIQARFILTVFYFVILAPFALVVRAADPLLLKPGKQHGWCPRTEPKGSHMDRALTQF